MTHSAIRVKVQTLPTNMISSEKKMSVPFTNVVAFFNAIFSWQKKWGWQGRWKYYTLPTIKCENILFITLGMVVQRQEIVKLKLWAHFIYSSIKWNKHCVIFRCSRVCEIAFMTRMCSKRGNDKCNKLTTLSTIFLEITDIILRYMLVSDKATLIDHFKMK